MNTMPRIFYDVGSSVGSDAAIGATLGSVIPGVGTLIGGAGGAAVGLVSGLIQKKKGNELLKKNPFPTEGLPNEELANQQIARGAATQGLPSEEYAQAQKNIQRNQAAQLATAQTAPGGAVRNIGAIQQNSNDAGANLTAASAQTRQQNIGQLLGVNNQVASWRDKLFDWNNKTKYAQNYNYAMGLVGQGNQNVMSGIDKAIGTTAGVAASGLFGGGNKNPGVTANPGGNMPGYNATALPGVANTGGAYANPGSASPAADMPYIGTTPNLLGQ
jgi:hypothetical protein